MDELTEIINNLPPGVAIELVQDDDHHVVVPMKLAEFVKRADDPDWFHVVMYAGREGGPEWCEYVEHRYFPPCTPENDNFKWQCIQWTGLPWIIISIPFNKRHLAYEAAEQTNMRIADGVPFDVGRQEFFPMCSPRVFHLENARDPS